MKKVMTALCATLFVSGVLFAQTAPKVLTQAELERFLDDLPKIGSDGEAENIDIDMDDSDEGDGSSMATSPVASMRREVEIAKKNTAAQHLIAKYGWDEHFWDVVYVVSLSYLIVTLDQSFPEGTIPDQVKPMYDEAVAAVHPADLELVRINRIKVAEAIDPDSEL